jgi:AmiR/NasT family two-component response regulator
LGAADLRIAQALADVATIGILQERAIHRAEILAEQLQTALNSRVVIEQAKGLLAAQGNLSVDEAFRRLRSYARNNNRRLSELALDVVDRRIAAEEVMLGN